MTYNQFRREFSYVIKGTANSWNEAFRMYEYVSTQLTTEVTNKQLLALCWAEYKRRNA